MANNSVSLLAFLKSIQLQMGCGGAIPRDSSGLSSILRVALGDGKFPDLPLLDSLLENKEITRIDKIDALEMAGAVILSYDQNHANFPLAFQYWRRALALRLMVTEEEGPIYKTPLKSKSGQPSEWSTLDDLQQMEQLPAQQRKIQSFLVRLRILSNISWSAIRSHFFQSFLEFLYVELHREDSISSLLDLAWSTVDTILRSERPHEENMQGSFIQIVAVVNLNLFRLKKDDPKLNSENLMKFFELILMTYSSHMMTSPAAQDTQISFVCCMFILLSRYPELITEEIRLSLLQLVHRDGRNSSGCNLLHSACNIPDSVSEALPTIRLLVNLGADLNARNNVGNGVLHILAVKEGNDIRDAKASLLVELGAHLDMTNKEGMTAADLWFQKNTPGKKDVADLPDWLHEGVPNLKCLSSRVIRRHKLPYDDGAILPVVLIPFVSLH